MRRLVAFGTAVVLATMHPAPAHATSSCGGAFDGNTECAFELLTPSLAVFGDTDTPGHVFVRVVVTTGEGHELFSCRDERDDGGASCQGRIGAGLVALHELVEVPLVCKLRSNGSGIYRCSSGPAG